MVDAKQTSFDQARAEVTRRRARWHAILLLVVWVPLAAFADPVSFGSVRAGLPYRIPAALAILALVLWLRQSRSRWAIEVAVSIAFSFVFCVWGLYEARCSVETILPVMLSIVLGSMIISTGAMLSWQGTAAFCLVANLAMLVGGLARPQRPDTDYFCLIATAFIMYPFLVFSAGARDRRARAELESQEQLGSAERAAAP